MNKNTKVLLTVLYVVFISFLEYFFISKTMPVEFIASTILFTVLFSIIMYYFKWFILDDGNLFRQPLFAVSILVPVYLFIILGVWVWKGNSMSFTSNGFSNFLIISKLPLLFLASSIPLASIVNNIHRTIQTEKQISESEKKNLSDSYYNHCRFTLDLFKTIQGKKIICNFKLNNSKSEVKETESQISIKYPLELYRKLFSTSSPEKGAISSVNTSFLIFMRNEWNVLYENAYNIINIKKDDDESFEDYQNRRITLYYNMNISYVNLCKHLCLEGFHSEYSFAINDKSDLNQFNSTFYNVSHMYNSIKSLEHVSLLILEKIYNKDVKKHFDINSNLFNIGVGFVNDWYIQFNFICFGNYQEPTLTQLR
ncbi:Uncharacterised protein [Serratia fonticola]|uniref:hypothetical protein n=1 Tax=Serratia fonticola TaxID=47917 RepID=UPI0021778B4A|nr:hypothetical protein [Serratia fonticola]CAI1000591.1 Uncharacterised protein [Serratia fonticola]